LHLELDNYLRQVNRVSSGRYFLRVYAFTADRLIRGFWVLGGNGSKCLKLRTSLKLQT